MYEIVLEIDLNKPIRLQNTDHKPYNYNAF